MANFVKGSLYIEIDKTKFSIYISRSISEIDSYLYANVILFISAFLKNEYGIEASILSKFEILEYNNIYKDYDFYEFLLIIFCIGCFIGFIIFLSGLIPEKIKERIKNIKHILYLSGCNFWAYWLGFFTIDYLKILIFLLLIIFPVYIYIKKVYFFFLNMIFIIISSLIFIYSSSFYFQKKIQEINFYFYYVLYFF